MIGRIAKAVRGELELLALLARVILGLPIAPGPRKQTIRIEPFREEDLFTAKRVRELAAKLAEEAKSPPASTAPAATEAAREIPPSSLEYVERARANMAMNDWNAIAVCRGSRKGCTGARDCDFCYWVRWHDTRPSAEILQAMERGDA